MTDLWWHQERGVEPPLLLVPGIGGAAAHFAALARALSGRATIAFDPRGCGQSPPLAAGAGLDALLDDLESVLCASGTTRAWVVGVSFGGILARLLAVERPGRVAGLVLVGTRARGEAPVRPPKGLVAKGAGPEARARALVGAYGAPGWLKRDPQGLEEAAKAFAAAPPLPATMACQQAALDTAEAGRVASMELAVPTLVVHGLEDPVIPHADGAGLAARLPGARLETLSPCGHLPSWERTADLAALVCRQMGG